SAARSRGEHAACRVRWFLRVSDEAARVSEPLSRGVPAWWRDAGMEHPPGRAFDPEVTTGRPRMTYRRLLTFLRPHTWRMAGTIACNIAAAVLDVFTFTLLIPFLDKLFNQPTRDTGITELQRRVIGPFLDAATPDTLLRNIIIVILA